MKVKKFKNGKVAITLENQNEINLIKSYFGASPCYAVEKAFNLKQDFLLGAYASFNTPNNIPMFQIFKLEE